MTPNHTYSYTLRATAYRRGRLTRGLIYSIHSPRYASPRRSKNKADLAAFLLGSMFLHISRCSQLAANYPYLLPVHMYAYFTLTRDKPYIHLHSIYSHLRLGKSLTYVGSFVRTDVLRQECGGNYCRRQSSSRPRALS